MQRLESTKARVASGTANGDRGSRPWLSVKETAVVLGVDEDTVYAELKKGTLPFDWKRIGRQYRISALSLGLGCGEEV